MTKKVLVIGLGISGLSAADFLLKKGFEVYGFDDNSSKLIDNKNWIELSQLGLKTIPFENIPFLTIDFAVISPGFPPSHRVVKKTKELNLPLLGEVELALQYINNQTLLGITGTNGKTTVTLLIEHILKSHNKKAIALGNIGKPLSTFTDSEPTIIIAELSSFQLETMESKVLDAAVLLNITPDHLDRYSSMLDYAKAKIKIGSLVKKTGNFIVEESTYQAYKSEFCQDQIVRYGYGSHLTYYTDLKYLYKKNKKILELPVILQNKRSHDLENFMAAFALGQLFDIQPVTFLESFSTFSKPPHRIQFISTINQISFYDDSKGTNIDAVIRAIEQMKGLTHLIAGGVDKGASYSPWISCFKDKVKNIFVIGEAAEKIENDLSSFFNVYKCKSLDEAVIKAYKMAKAGENILLSPGCSSFDMFKDYTHRGKEFQRVVKELVTL